MGVSLLLRDQQREDSFINREYINSNMGKGQNEGGFSEEQLQMYKDCFKLMDINKTAPWTKTTSVELSTMSVCLCPSPSWTASSARSVVPAPTTTWSRCSRRRWPETATTLTTSSSRPSRLTTLMARSTPRCSSTPS